MFCDGLAWQSVVLSLLVPETHDRFCCNKSYVMAVLTALMPPTIPLLTFTRGGTASCCAFTSVLFSGTSCRMGWFSASWIGCCASSTGLQWEQVFYELQEASNRPEPYSHDMQTYSIVLLVSFFSLELFVLATLAKVLVFFFFFSCSSVLALTCATCDVVFVLGAFYNSHKKGP